jgi:hypothetical protein
MNGKKRFIQYGFETEPFHFHANSTPFGYRTRSYQCFFISHFIENAECEMRNCGMALKMRNVKCGMRNAKFCGIMRNMRNGSETSAHPWS